MGNVKCPNCATASWNGVSKCECGYDPATATTGRPMITEKLELPAAPRGAAAMAIILGAAMCIGGGVLAYMAYSSAAPVPPYDWRYVVGVCAVGVGIMRFRKGCSLADE
jgi:hypothetical protein